MGMLGDLFPDRKLQDESGEDADGEPVGRRWDVDLDGGVVRLGPVNTPARPGPVNTPARPESDPE